jgi:hypothetical protein
MTELELYDNLMSLCIAHKNNVEWRECHGFGVGYMHQINTDNFSQSDFRKGLFYSEKWYKSGTNPNSMMLDFPFVLMLPVEEHGNIDRTGKHSGIRQFTVVFFVLDLLYNDRNGNTNSAYSKRSYEQVHSDTQRIGEEILMEYNNKFFNTIPKSYLANDGAYTAQKITDVGNKKLAGTSFEFTVKMHAGCSKGTFDYDKEYSEKKEKFCKC